MKKKSTFAVKRLEASWRPRLSEDNYERRMDGCTVEAIGAVMGVVQEEK